MFGVIVQCSVVLLYKIPPNLVGLLRSGLATRASCGMISLALLRVTVGGHVCGKVFDLKKVVTSVDISNRKSE